MAALEQLIEAVKAQTAETQRLISVTEKLVTLRTEAIDHVKQTASPAEKVSAKKTEPKAEKPAEKPKEEVKTAPSPVTNDITLEQIKEAIGGDTPAPDFMKQVVAAYVNWGGTENEPVSTDEREARKTKIKELLAHPKVNAPNVAGVPEGARKAVLKKLAEWIEGLAPAVTNEEVDDL